MKLEKKIELAKMLIERVSFFTEALIQVGASYEKEDFIERVDNILFRVERSCSNIRNKEKEFYLCCDKFNEVNGFIDMGDQLEQICSSGEYSIIDLWFNGGHVASLKALIKKENEIYFVDEINWQIDF